MIMGTSENRAERFGAPAPEEIMRKRLAAILLAAATTALAFSGATAHAATIVPTDDPPAGYTYEGTFYWHDSCEEAGKGGVPRAWSTYVCIGDGWPWDSYDLYVKYS